MFENIMKIFKISNKNKGTSSKSKEAAKERLHLVLMQDRANVSVDFLELMKQEIIDVIKKYIEVDDDEIDVRLTNKENGDGTNGAPALYANIPILNIKNDLKKDMKDQVKKEESKKAEQNQQEKPKKEKEVKKKEEDKNKKEKVKKKVKVEKKEENKNKTKEKSM